MYGRFIIGGKNAVTHCLGHRVGPRACLDVLEEQNVYCLFPPTLRITPVTVPGLKGFVISLMYNVFIICAV
jgi:hypothetical protein